MKNFGVPFCGTINIMREAHSYVFNLYFLIFDAWFLPLKELKRRPSAKN